MVDSFVELLSADSIKFAKQNEIAKLNEIAKPNKVTLESCQTENKQIKVKKMVKQEELHKSERNSSSPDKKFPSIEKGEKKPIKVEKKNE